MKSDKYEKHEFALFCSSLSELVDGPHQQELYIDDTDLVHRINVVLRLSVGDVCILFDRYCNVQCIITKRIGKKQILCSISNYKKNEILHPPVTFFLPLLKRNDFESSLYSLSEIGITTIQLVISEKSRNSWKDVDRDRAERVIIAAAEQSKNFSYPLLLPDPVVLSDGFSRIFDDSSTNIFFDPCGEPLSCTIQNILSDKSRPIVLLIGPEADMTYNEKKYIKNAGFIFCALTPTVLRATQAAAISAGIIRSLSR